MAIYRRRTSRRRVLIAGLLSLSAILISIDFQDGAASSALGKSLGGLVQSVDAVVGAVTRPVGQFFSGIFSAGEIRAENERLREEIEELRQERLNAAVIERENKELRELTNLQNPGELEAVTTKVAGQRFRNFEWTMELDAGTKNGLARDNPVVTGRGLVGRVVQVSSGRSKVILLRDPSFSVGVRDLRSGETGVLSGEGENPLSLELVDANADVKRGDVMVTSGFEGSRFPPSIQIGRVSSVKKDKTGLALRAEIEPFENALRRRYVSVLLWIPQ